MSVRNLEALDGGSGGMVWRERGCRTAVGDCDIGDPRKGGSGEEVVGGCFGGECVVVCCGWT